MELQGPSVPVKRGLRLLSLEGGGIKGLTLVWQLRALERAAGRPIHELFDLIAGVSTAGAYTRSHFRST
jgi:patatin-like phospholipase/acyl hydrolase